MQKSDVVVFVFCFWVAELGFLCHWCYVFWWSLIWYNSSTIQAMFFKCLLLLHQQLFFRLNYICILYDYFKTIYVFLFVFVIWIYLCVVHFYLVIQFAVNVHEKLWSFYPIKVLIMLECFDCWDLDWEAHLCERQLFSLLSIRYFSTTIQLLSVIYFPVTIHQIRCCC